MSRLDGMKEIAKYDRSDMLGILESFPEQCENAESIGRKFVPPASYKIVYSNIIFTGMGGSAIGPEILRSYIWRVAEIPVFVNRGYRMPGFTGEKSLVVAISYSGDTEETVSAYMDARSRRAKIIAVTSGGRLRALAEKDSVPMIELPPGLQPRCAVGYLFFPILKALSKVGVISDRSRDVREAVKTLEALRRRQIGSRLPESRNIAKRIAHRLHGKFPVIYGSSDFTDCMVTRWRGELAENAKQLSSGHLFPEMNHNEIAGWENPSKALKSFIAVFLRDTGDHPRVSKRMDITVRILKRGLFEVIEVRPPGKTSLARLFSFLYIGDFVSFYLAILNMTDPTPVERIAYLKKELK